MALNSHTLEVLDSKITIGAAAQIVDSINNQHTTKIDGYFRDRLAKVLGSIGEASSFITNMSSTGTPSVGQLNIISTVLGRDVATDLNTAITTATA